MASGRRARLQPRWFIVAFWHGHRAVLRATGGRFGLWRPKPGGWGRCGSRRPGDAATQRRVVLGYVEDGRNLVTMAMNGWARPSPRGGSTCRRTRTPSSAPATGCDRSGTRRAQGQERERLWARWAEIDKNLDDFAARRPHETASSCWSRATAPHPMTRQESGDDDRVTAPYRATAVEGCTKQEAAARLVGEGAVVGQRLGPAEVSRNARPSEHLRVGGAEVTALVAHTARR